MMNTNIYKKNIKNTIKIIDMKLSFCYNSITDVRKVRLVWGISSAGRAPRLHRGGQRFDPAMLHHMKSKGLE